VLFTLDFIVFVIFVVVQSRITVLAWRAARERLPEALLRPARTALVVFNGALLLGFGASITALVSRLGLPSQVSLVLGASALFYVLIATSVLLVHTAMVLLRRFALPPDADPGRRRLLNAAGTLAATTPFAALGYGAFIQRTDFTVREVDAAIPGLPADLSGLKLLHLSDIHLSAFLSEAELEDVIAEANQLRPHIAVVTGDLITSIGDPLDACLRQLSRLRTDAGVLGCLGNHERYARAESYTASAGERLGLRFLRNECEARRFGNGVLNFAGVDYQSVQDRNHYLDGGERLLASNATNILLSHNPDVFPVAARQGYQLLLAGHTHGGQVTIEILDQGINPARFLTPYVYGWYHSGGAAAYVTRGIGTVGIPARLGAPPEITLLRLRKA
jgi:predicted MPP superfamily phosphohydrolase